jgi:hypothetical protein
VSRPVRTAAATLSRQWRSRRMGERRQRDFFGEWLIQHQVAALLAAAAA